MPSHCACDGGVEDRQRDAGTDPPHDPLAGQLEPGKGNGLKDWLDFSLLPPFDKIAKYFHFTVYGGRLTPDGYSYQIFSPTPPQFKK